MSCVEAFATEIKIESRESLFGGRSRNQGDLGTAKTQEPTMHGYNLTLTLGNQAIKSLRRERSSDQAPFFLLIEKLNRGRKRFYRRHISDYILALRLLVSSLYSHKPAIFLLSSGYWLTRQFAGVAARSTLLLYSYGEYFSTDTLYKG